MAWIVWFGYAGLIFYLSSRQLGPILAGFPPNTDKLIHMIEYGGFGALTYYALGTTSWAPEGRWHLALAIVIGIAYGVSDEFHQAFVPTRDSDVHDVMADAVGSALGAWAVARVIHHRRVSNQSRVSESLEK
jgi:VanZ family protein